ncbi:MAG: GatB/YqeY domain-containing protein [Hyphomicrobiales bacterium]|nr:MAG: GatB/YqeY domain-containing protein [Hyphomicrobiales bacterium]
MRTRLSDEIKAAMKAHAKDRLGTLRLISAALKDRDLNAEGGKIADQEIPAVLQKMVKQRRDSVTIYQQAGRQELADKELAEIAVIEEFLPKSLSEEDAKAAIAAAIKETGAAGPKDMGKVMGLLKQKFAGQMDFGKASGQVKDQLNALGK